MMWDGHQAPWYQRPLRCVFRMHQWRQHPHVSIVAYCADCGLERSIAHWSAS